MLPSAVMHLRSPVMHLRSCPPDPHHPRNCPVQHEAMREHVRVSAEAAVAAATRRRRRSSSEASTSLGPSIARGGGGGEDRQGISSRMRLTKRRASPAPAAKRDHVALLVAKASHFSYAWIPTSRVISPAVHCRPLWVSLTVLPLPLPAADANGSEPPQAGALQAGRGWPGGGGQGVPASGQAPHLAGSEAQSQTHVGGAGCRHQYGCEVRHENLSY